MRDSKNRLICNICHKLIKLGEDREDKNYHHLCYIVKFGKKKTTLQSRSNAE